MGLILGRFGVLDGLVVTSEDLQGRLRPFNVASYGKFTMPFFQKIQKRI